MNLLLTDYLLILILVLIAYVLFLQYKLNKKNKFIKHSINKILKYDNISSKKEFMRLMKELESFDFKTLIPKDKILNENILNFIFESEPNSKLYIHYTNEDKISLKIISEGFRFVSSFYKTAERVNHDMIDFVYKHNRHKAFGEYAVIIVISNNIFDYYKNEINKLNNNDVKVEQILTEKQYCTDENNNKIYILSNKFVKGYFNYESGVIVKNPEFNPEYNCDKFKENLKKISN